MIVVNDVSDQRIGFNSNDNAVTVITADGEDRIDIGTKSEIAHAIIDRVVRLRSSAHRRDARRPRCARAIPARRPASQHSRSGLTILQLSNKNSKRGERRT